jgi:hypothetical protein
MKLARLAIVTSFLGVAACADVTGPAGEIAPERLQVEEAELRGDADGGRTYTVSDAGGGQLGSGTSTESTEETAEGASEVPSRTQLGSGTRTQLGSGT